MRLNEHLAETILVEDSKLVALCWRLESTLKRPLKVYSTPHELLETLPWQQLNPASVFVVDVDFAGLDSLSGIDLVEKMRTMGVKNRIYLYSGFSEIIPQELISRGVVDGIHSKDLSPREVIEKLFPAG